MLFDIDSTNSSPVVSPRITSPFALANYPVMVFPAQGSWYLQNATPLPAMARLDDKLSTGYAF